MHLKKIIIHLNAAAVFRGESFMHYMDVNFDLLPPTEMLLLSNSADLDSERCNVADVMVCHHCHSSFAVKKERK